jgi:hypothetical protein
MNLAVNPRAVIGGNAPPSPIDLARSSFDDLSRWLKDHPVISTEAQAREAKLFKDRADSALKAIEEARVNLVAPLNEQVREINAEHHQYHNGNSGKPGIFDKILVALKFRMTAYAKAEEAKREAIARAAREAAERAEREAREAETREREAHQEAAQGVCDVDIGRATADADQAFADFKKADRELGRAERNATVRIGGGFGKVTTLRTQEVLTVTDWQAAIADMLDDDGLIPECIHDAILTAARAHRKMFGELPTGIGREEERKI